MGFERCPALRSIFLACRLTGKQRNIHSTSRPASQMESTFSESNHWLFTTQDLPRSGTCHVRSSLSRVVEPKKATDPGYTVNIYNNVSELLFKRNLDVIKKNYGSTLTLFLDQQLLPARF
jgi:hypothetical protein